MSWSRRKVLRLGALPLVGLPLAACGFEPLYGPGINNADVSSELAAVRVNPLRDRVGQQMHNFLRDRLNPHGQPVSPNYALQVDLTETLSELGVRRDETATRANLRMEADFVLTGADGASELLRGYSSSTTSYNILNNPFATTVSEDSARERALREVAEDIKTRLALYFSKR